MLLTILNSSFVKTDIIESAESFIWVERYNDAGDFEFVDKYSYTLLSKFPLGGYLSIPNSTRLMVIETISIKTNLETGDKLIVKGRSIESILDKRIILSQLLLDSSLQSAVQTILNNNVINGTYPERNFPNFIFSTSTDPLVTTPTIKAQYYTQNLLDVIVGICKQSNLGFKIIINSSNQYVFSLYAGADRSYTQSTNPFVIFSPKYDNLIESEYLRTIKFKKNYCLVSGDTSGKTSFWEGEQVWTSDVGTGLNRMEMFSDGSDLPKYNQATGLEISDVVYHQQLRQRGLEQLAINAEISMFDAKVDVTRTFIYNTSFYLGDIVQTEDNYGHSNRVRVTEMTFSENLGETSMYPTLQVV